MKINKYIGIMMVAAGMLTTVTSCKDDWSPLAEESSTSQSAANTLWQNISLDQNLTDFAKVLKKVGYDTVLDSPHFYTVWAPVNGTYDVDSLLQLDSVTILNTFVQNHIAEYNHGYSGAVAERVFTLNKKAYNFSSENNSFAGVGLGKTNIPSCNGVMHLLQSPAPFRYNLYEYLAHSEGIDSVAAYLNQYNDTTLDKKNSVVGPIINGIQTYLDSVMVVSNNFITRQLGAQIDEEDSTYTMLAPTNDCWNNMKSTISAYYNYLPSSYAMKYQDLEGQTSTSLKAADAAKTVTFNPTYLNDSLVKYNIARVLYYNNNLKYNRFLVGEKALPEDTLYSTSDRGLSNADDILTHQAGATETLSNGYIRKMADMPLRPWETFAQTLHPRDIGRTLSIKSAQSYFIKKDVLAEKITEGFFPEGFCNLDSTQTQLTFRLFKGTSNMVKPEVDIYLDNVLSHKYNIYAVIFPAGYGITADDTLNLPNQLKFTLNYLTAKGVMTDQVLQAKIENNPAKVDTLFLGSFEFPVCYYGTGATPNIKIQTVPNFVLSANRKKYAVDIRLVGIIMRPVEYDEYLATKEN